VRRPAQISDHLCECGCGEFTQIARTSAASKGWVRGEPVRFVYGHGLRGRKRRMWEPGDPSGVLCACGCGEETLVTARGQRPKYLAGHQFPWPKCECGCGADVPTRTSRFLPGHANLAKVRRRYQVDEASGCWDWRGQFSVDGYPRFRIGTVDVRAHRWFYEDLVGPVPAGFHVHHECRNKRCVNPAHLVAVSLEEHTLLHMEERIEQGKRCRRAA
jgi:hypothetical protein